MTEQGSDVAKIKDALKVVQQMIDISADRLNGLRTQCAPNADLTRQEIRTLEGKLLKMFARQLVIKSNLKGREDALFIFTYDMPSLVQWLQVVGLPKKAIDSICDKVDSLEKLQEKTDHELDAILKRKNCSCKDVKKLHRALFNLRRYIDILQHSDQPTDDSEKDLELYWDSWDNKELDSVDETPTSVEPQPKPKSKRHHVNRRKLQCVNSSSSKSNSETGKDSGSSSSLTSCLSTPPPTPPVVAKALFVETRIAPASDLKTLMRIKVATNNASTLTPGFPLIKSKSHESQLSSKLVKNTEGLESQKSRTTPRRRLTTEPGAAAQRAKSADKKLERRLSPLLPIRGDSLAPVTMIHGVNPSISNPISPNTSSSSSRLSTFNSPCTPKLFQKTPSPQNYNYPPGVSSANGQLNAVRDVDKINAHIPNHVPHQRHTSTSSSSSLVHTPLSSSTTSITNLYSTATPSSSISSPHKVSSSTINFGLLSPGLISPTIITTTHPNNMRRHSSHKSSIVNTLSASGIGKAAHLYGDENVNELNSAHFRAQRSKHSSSKSDSQSPSTTERSVTSSQVTLYSDRVSLTNGSQQVFVNEADNGDAASLMQSRSMRHYIAHRFTKMYKMIAACDYCGRQILFVTGLKCRECKYKCHKECENKVPPSCGLPSEFINVFKCTISTSAPQNQSPNPGPTPMSSPVHHHHNNIFSSLRRERKRSYPQNSLGAHSPMKFQDSGSNTSSCNSSTPSSPAALTLPHTTTATSNKTHFSFPDVDMSSTHPNIPPSISELIETQTSNDSDKTVMATTGSGGSGSTEDSDRTPPVRIDSQESQVSDNDLIFERDEKRWPRQNSQLSMREWDIPYDELKLGEPIGIGRFGTVHRGNWHGDVAIKLLNMDYMDDDKALEQFKDEVGTFRKTRHENLILFMGACMKPPRLAIVTSLSKGMTLYTHIHLRKDKFNMNKTTIVAQQISQGMGYLHARGIVHKDLKSKNIFLENGKVVITDFGLFSVTKLCYGNGKANGLNIPPGWLCYLSPEIVRSLRANQSHRQQELPFSKASDVYAFGTVWYELLCGEWPFKGQSPEAVIWQVGKGMKQPLANLQASRDVKDILMLCWGYRPSDRPDFSNLLNLLEKLPKKRLARSPSHPVHLSRSAESVF